MEVKNILNESTINLDLDANSKIEAITDLTKMLFESGRIGDQEAFLNEVLERELIESTDMGIGVAIPHAISNSVIEASVAIGKLKKSFFWSEGEGGQDQPIYAIFLLASSESAAGYSHLEIISKVATLLIDDAFIEILKTTTNKTVLLKEIVSFIGEM